MSSEKVNLAIDRLKGLILSGELQAGERLPKEADLAGSLGVSRNSLREAVRAMQAMHVLDARQGDGTYVSNLDPADMMEVLQFAVDVSGPQSVIWFLELRRLLELAAVQEATVHRTEEQLDALQTLHERMMVEEESGSLMNLDVEFHNSIAQFGGNPIQASLLKVVSRPTLQVRIWRQRLADRDFGRMRREHALIVSAIESRDIDAARHAMWSHLEDVIQWVKDNPDDVDNPTLRH